MPKPGSGPLTKKEQVFVQEYLIDLNAAALRAPPAIRKRPQT
jgi:hypothetical protein